MRYILLISITCLFASCTSCECYECVRGADRREECDLGNGIDPITGNTVSVRKYLSIMEDLGWDCGCVDQ